jgi:Neprosin
MANPLGILPHDAWRDLVEVAHVDQFRYDPRARVDDESTLRDMKSYLADLYTGVEVVHSFEDPGGNVFDCVPVEQQPALREHSGELPAAPDLRPVLAGGDPEPGVPAIEAAPEEPPLDRHGNSMQAPPGTIPMRRVTLTEMARFADVRDFSRKGPGPAGQAPTSPTAAAETTPASAPAADTSLNHRYAYTRQTVDNIGAHDALAVYAPAVDANQVFSLAQHWYAGGSGTGHQTVEVGWQVYPAKYGHALPVLFIYWTADNYRSTGAYNLDAPAFVQTNGSWTIGGALSPVSVRGGQQWEIDIAVYLFEGNWWLYLGGVAASNAVGYYPTSLYRGGAMATKASEILFGGETVCTSVGWPPMGSGALAAEGWQKAAYQRQIYFFPTGGGAQWASLTPEQPSPGVYTVDLGTAASPWGIYFFYGGPGGSDA